MRMRHANFLVAGVAKRALRADVQLVAAWKY